MILGRCELEQHYIGACTHHRGEGSRNSMPLSRGSDSLDAQLHLALQQLCVELLHQLLLNLALLGLKAREAQVELTLFLFKRVD